jgi:hypothetical protein
MRFLCDEDVDDLAELVDRAVEIDPSPGEFDVRFVHEPPITAGACRQGRAASISSGVNRCTQREMVS